jgi:thiosulfate/3-mercaptopyruvate sulfurtransferase
MNIAQCRTAVYRGAHIPGAIMAGPGSQAEGVESLKKAVHELPRNGEIVLYCGCCPFVRCPNVRPAYTALREMGFSHVKVIAIETNLHTDWVAKGYPVEKGG